VNRRSKARSLSETATDMSETVISAVRAFGDQHPRARLKGKRQPCMCQKHTTHAAKSTGGRYSM
jgi:hypothetical protein